MKLPTLRQVALFVYEIYLCVLWKLESYKFHTIVFLSNVINKCLADNTDDRESIACAILYNNVTTRDVTHLMRLYYKFDDAESVASMTYWLKAEELSKVRIITANKSNLYDRQFTIGVVTEGKNLLTGESLLCDTSLSTISRVILVQTQPSTKEMISDNPIVSRGASADQTMED